MAPRSVGEIFSAITSSEDEETIIKVFMENMAEIFTHPRMDITNHLIYLKDSHASGLRCHLYSIVVKNATTHFKDDFIKIGIMAEDFVTLSSRLSRRYKITAIYDDICTLSVSLIEKSLHKDFKKLLTQAAPKKKSSATANHVEIENIPQMQSFEKPIIDAITEIKSIVSASRKENKELKAKIDLLTTKIDQQSKENGYFKTKIDILTSKIDQQSKEIASLKMGPPSNNTSSNSKQPSPQQQAEHIKRNEEQLQVASSTLQPEMQMQQQTQLQQELHSAQNNLQQQFTANQQQQSKYTYKEATVRNILNTEPDISSRQIRPQGFGSIIQPFQCQTGLRRDCINKETCFYRHLGEQVGEPIPKNEWNTVTHKRRKPPLFGSKQRTEGTIAGLRTIREFSIFVGGVCSRLSVEDFSKHVKDNFDVSPINVAQNKRNQYNQSFKLTIRSNDKDKIFNAEMWDENIIIKPFRERRNSENGEKRNGTLHMSTFDASTPL